MKPLISGLLIALLCTPLQAALPVSVDGQQLPSLAPMLERVTPAVVNIATRGKSLRRYELPLPNDPFFRRFFDVPSIERVQEVSSLGSRSKFPFPAPIDNAGLRFVDAFAATVKDAERK